MPDAPISIRPLDPSDGPFLLAWRNDPTAFRWYHDARPVTEDEHGRWLAVRQAATTPTVWIALDGTDRVGSVRVDQHSDGSAHVSIVVDPRSRGLGVGGALLEYCLMECQRRGWADVRAEVHRLNVTSLALFTNRGFVEAARDGDFIQLRLA